MIAKITAAKAIIAALRADADGSAQTVAALRAEVAAYRVEADEQRNEAETLRSQIRSLKIELRDADIRLEEIGEILRRCERSGIEAFHDSLTAALYRNSL